MQDFFYFKYLGDKFWCEIPPQLTWCSIADKELLPIDKCFLLLFRPSAS